MAENMMENINTIKSMAMVFIIGKMVENMKVIGKWENNMEEENIFYQMELVNKESGKMGNVLDGLIKLMNE